MVSTGLESHFTTVIDDFFALKHVSGRNGDLLKSIVRARADSLLSHPDARYMPAFKILDLLAAFVDVAAAIAAEPQLRPNEAKALMRESLSDSTPLVHHFMLEAALERVRYEPLMLAERPNNSIREREMILQLRWSAMRAAHQEKADLPEAWMDAIDNAVESALTAPEFQHFRQGPLLQMFAEMLSMGRTLHHREASLSELADILSEQGPLWKRYALKTSRFREKAAMPSAARLTQASSHTIH